MPPLDASLGADTDVSARSGRASVLAFVADAETEAGLRDGLADLLPAGIDVRRANVRTAIATLSAMPTPSTLIVDLSGEEQPLARLGDLSQVVEPNVRVLVIGERQDVNFYRQVTRNLGALEYLYKPLIRDMVARHFGPVVGGQAQVQDASHGGRMVTVTGARGGSGASTIAANLAWYLGVQARRHTVLLDADLHRGVGAMLLGTNSDSGLRTALETPARIDELFLERVAQPAADRLHVLSGEEQLTEQPSYASGAALRLSDALRRRYNFVVTDLPFDGQPWRNDLLLLAQQRVLVTVPTLAGIRDTVRLLSLPSGPAQSRRAVVVLNRVGMPGGLDLRRVKDGLGLEPDVLIPDVKRAVEWAASLGQPAAKAHGAFRKSIAALAREIGLATAAGGQRWRGLRWWRT